MKKILLSMICFAFVFAAANAQMLTFGDTMLVATGEPTEGDVGVYTAMTNVTQSTLDLRWERTSEEIPEGWESWVCTVPGNCGLPHTQTLDFEIGAGEQGEFQYHFRGNDISGTGTVTVNIINNANDEILQTITIMGDLSTVNVNEIDAANIKMFPNPADDYFQLTNAHIVDQVIIYNVLGKQVKYFGTNEENFFVGDLAKGIYLVQLTDLDSSSVKTLRLKKN